MSEETNTTTQKADKCTTCQCPNFVRDNIMTRLKQESTWRGLITIATLAGWRLAPDQAEAIITAGASLVGTINILKRD